MHFSIIMTGRTNARYFDHLSRWANVQNMHHALGVGSRLLSCADLSRASGCSKKQLARADSACCTSRRVHTRLRSRCRVRRVRGRGGYSDIDQGSQVTLNNGKGDILAPMTTLAPARDDCTCAPSRSRSRSPRARSVHGVGEPARRDELFVHGSQGRQRIAAARVMRSRQGST